MFSRTAGTNVAAVAQPHPSQNVTTGIHKWEGKSKKENCIICTRCKIT